MPRLRIVWLFRAIALVSIVTALTLVVRNVWRGQVRRSVASRTVEVRKALFAEIQPVHLTNCELRRFGEPNDGGYPLCVNLLEGVKVGYSYGIAGYDRWGCEVSRHLHVPVHEYDCFDLRAPACPDGRTVFHGECIGTVKETQDGRPFDTMSNQFARNENTSTRVVMKIDVEGAEWDAFLLAPDSTLSQLDQIDVEFHHVEDAKYVESIRRLKQFFYVAHVHYNNFSCDPLADPFPAWAFEVLLVNKRIAMSDGSPAPPASGVDAPNDGSAADCQSAARSTAQVGRFIG
jgi:Methyltransferase FkbM domain